MILAGILDWLTQHANVSLSWQEFFEGALIGCSLTAFVCLIADCIRRRPSLRPFEALASQSPWTAADIRGMLVYFLGFWFLILTLLYVARPQPDDSGVVPPYGIGATLLMIIIATHGTMALFIVGRLKKLNLRLPAFLGLIHPQRASRLVPLGIILFLASLPVLEVTTQLWGYMLEYIGLEIAEQPALSVFQSPGESIWVLGLILIFETTIGPILEEAIFRGMVLPIVTRQFGAIYAIVIVSLFFALLHPIQFLVPIFVISVFFSLGYAWSGSLLVPMVMHICFNTTQLVALYLTSHSNANVIGP